MPEKIEKKNQSQLASVKATINKFKEESINILFPDMRHQQLLEVSFERDDKAIRAVEKKIDRDFMIALSSLGLIGVGNLLYPPLELLALPGLVWTSIPFIKDAYNTLVQERKVGVDAMTTVFFVGAIVTGYYFALALVACFSRLNRKLLIRTQDYSQQNLINLFSFQRSTIRLLSDGIEVEIPFDAVQIGDTIVVHASEMIPIDGIITSGEALVDQHVLTGESQPAEKEVGDRVFASTVVLSGQILITVEKAGSDTVAAQIAHILNDTGDATKSIQSWGEAIAERSAQGTLAVSALALPLVGSGAALTVLCSCIGILMKILGPLSMLSFLNLASKRGILIKDGRSLQVLGEIDTVVFDKTGTLTQEIPHVGQIYTYNGMSEEKLLEYAAAAEYKQTHPIAKAIRAEAKVRGLILPAIDEAKYEVGYGIKVQLSNHSSSTNQVIRVGSARFIEMEGIEISADIKKIHQTSYEQGHSLVYVAIDDQLGGAIELHATIRPEAKQIIKNLQQRNMSIYIISGDHENPTRKLAESLGIEHYFANTLPENKANLISQLEKEGKSVCFVGDGINDSIALKKAKVSISLRGASTIATDTAQIVLMNQSLDQLVQIFDIAQDFKRNIKINLLATTLPGIAIIGGAFLLGLQVTHVIIFNGFCFWGCVANTIWPLIKERQLEKQSKKSGPHT